MGHILGILGGCGIKEKKTHSYAKLETNCHCFLCKIMNKNIKLTNLAIIYQRSVRHTCNCLIPNSDFSLNVKLIVINSCKCITVWLVSQDKLER